MPITSKLTAFKESERLNSNFLLLDRRCTVATHWSVVSDAHPFTDVRRSYDPVAHDDPLVTRHG